MLTKKTTTRTAMAVGALLLAGVLGGCPSDDRAGADQDDHSSHEDHGDHEGHDDHNDHDGDHK